MKFKKDKEYVYLNPVETNWIIMTRKVFEQMKCGSCTKSLCDSVDNLLSAWDDLFDSRNEDFEVIG